MHLKARLALVLFAFAPFLVSLPAKAMALEDFARMNNDDEAGFVAFLVDAASKMLKEQGHPDQSDKVITLFSTPGPSGGVYRLGDNLKTLYGQNKRASDNPNNRKTPYSVEDAMSMTLKDDGIDVPASYLLKVSVDFRPSGPPRQHAASL